MSTYDDASLIYYPSGYKASKAYSLKPTDGSGDLDFTRASTATRVNESGLIEEVATGVPRIDFTSGCGKLLLEPQRTNLLLQSENISSASWIKGGAIITPNAATSPDGTINADLVSGVAGKSFYQSSIAVTSSTLYTLSFYVKNVNLTNSKLAIRDDTNGAFIVQDIAYTISTDEWTRIVYTFTTPIGCLSARVYPLRSPTNTGSAYFWGGQLELGSYPTSYIPTTSTAVTRVADAASKSGISSLIGQTEGTIYLEFDNRLLTSYPNEYIFLIRNPSGTSQLYIRKENGSNAFTVRLIVGGVNIWTNTSYLPISGINKIAVAYKTGDSAVFANGSQVSTTNTSSFSGSSFDDLYFNLTGTLNPELRLQSSLLFTTRKSNTELADLTTL